MYTYVIIIILIIVPILTIFACVYELYSINIFMCIHYLYIYYSLYIHVHMYTCILYMTRGVVVANKHVKRQLFCHSLILSAGDELDGSWFLGELVLLIDCVVALHQSKVVSTHLWNTPRATSTNRL